MWFRTNKLRFHFCFCCCFLLSSNFVLCVEDDDFSTSYPSEDEDKMDTQDIALVVLVVAIMVALVFLVILSIVFIVSGFVVSGQWPRPDFCCWTLPMNDRSSRGCSCCSLYQANISLAVIWLMLLVFMLLSHVWQLIVLSAGSVLLHILAAYALHRQFQKSGWPIHDQQAPPYPSRIVVMNQLGPAGDENVFCPTQQHYQQQPIPFVTAYISQSQNSVVIDHQQRPISDSLPKNGTPHTNTKRIF